MLNYLLNTWNGGYLIGLIVGIIFGVSLGLSF